MSVEETPSFEEVQSDPHKGDLLCYDGKRWKVARRDGWNYPVPDPDAVNAMDFEMGEDGVWRDPNPIESTTER